MFSMFFNELLKFFTDVYNAIYNIWTFQIFQIGSYTFTAGNLITSGLFVLLGLLFIKKFIPLA